MHSIRIVITILTVAFVGSACAVSNSVVSISDSASSPFGWSSDSSDSSSGGDTAYRQDVSDYTLAFARQGGELDAFRSGIRALAERRGVTNWEDDPYTCASIGLGMQRATLGEAAATEFGASLFGTNASALEAYQAGYTSIQ